MSSTDDAELRRLFARQLVPAAARLRERGVAFLPPGPEPGEWSGYREMPESEDELLDASPDAFAARLEALWREEGLPELAELVEPLMRLAENLASEADETAEVSPSLYVMY